MDFWQSVALGILQGISEFIPISSSGHLVVARVVMGLELADIPLLYDVVLHIATLIVVIVFFRERILRMVGALARWVARRSTADDAVDLRLAWLVFLGTLVTVAVGLSIRRLDLHLYPRVVAGAFLVTAILLVLAHFTRGHIDYDGLTLRHGVVVGFVQGLAVVPGISRSGSTIWAALASGISRERAGEYSFLLSIPAILGALVLELRHLGDLGAAVSPVVMAAGFVASLVFGFLSLSLLVMLIRGGKLWVFSIYLVPLGIWGLLTF